MNKTLIIEDIEDIEYLQKITDVLEKLEKDEILDIFLNSNGGSVIYYGIVTDKLNLLIDRGFNINIYAYKIYSACFDLFYKFKGNKYIQEDCIALVHIMTYSDPVFIHNGKVKLGGDKYIRDKILNSNFTDYDFLTEEEREIFYNGDDIILGEKRLKEIFKQD